MAQVDPPASSSSPTVVWTQSRGRAELVCGETDGGGTTLDAVFVTGGDGLAGAGATIVKELPQPPHLAGCPTAAGEVRNDLAHLGQATVITGSP